MHDFTIGISNSLIFSSNYKDGKPPCSSVLHNSEHEVGAGVGENVGSDVGVCDIEGDSVEVSVGDSVEGSVATLLCTLYDGGSSL